MKKLATMALSIGLIGAMVAGGSLAYLTSEDSDVNVMTLGNVQIEQHEYERVVNADGTYEMVATDRGEGYKVQKFTQAKPLMPAVGKVNGWDEDVVYWEQLAEGKADGYQAPLAGLNNVQDKFVLVENTGKSDAYVRTIIAFEVGEKPEAFDNLIMNSYAQFWVEDQIGVVDIDGNKYYVVEYVYNGSDVRHINGVLPAGDYTYNSLAQVYLKGEATNEDVEAIDGNDNGTYDILVLSQAVQTAGFADAKTALDEAFGEVTAGKAAEWFAGTAIPDILESAIDLNKSTTKNGTFVLGNDIETSGDASITDDTRYGYGYEYIVRKGVDYTLDLNGKTIAHKAINKNANNNAFTYLFVANNAGTKLTIDGYGKINSNNSEGYTCAVQGKDGTLVTIKGGDFQVDNGIAVWAGAGAHIVINDGSFVNGNAKTDHELIYSSGGVIDIYGGFFHNTDGNYTLNIEDRNRATGFINVYGGTFVNFDPSTGGQDPNNIKVADGYKVVSETQANGDIWYTVVAE